MLFYSGDHESENAQQNGVHEQPFKLPRGRLSHEDILTQCAL